MDFFDFDDQALINNISILSIPKATTPEASSSPSTPGKRKAGTPLPAPPESTLMDSPSKRSKVDARQEKDEDSDVLLMDLPSKKDMMDK
jgi:hypothetical protein